MVSQKSLNDEFSSKEIIKIKKKIKTSLTVVREIPSHKEEMTTEQAVELHPTQNWGGGFMYTGAGSDLVELPTEFVKMTQQERGDLASRIEEVPGLVREALNSLPVGDEFSFWTGFDTVEEYSMEKVGEGRFLVSTWDEEEQKWEEERARLALPWDGFYEEASEQLGVRREVIEFLTREVSGEIQG